MPQKLLLPTGGKTDLKLFEKFKIKTKEFAPSLVALKTNSTKRLNGVKVSNVLVSATCGKKINRELGEVLFKESGLSGIVIFNMSALFARENNYSGEIEIDLMPNFKEDEVLYLLNSRKNLSGNILEGITGLFMDFIINLFKVLFGR